ncbi:MAG: signal peptidase I [Candidatus Izimaplasma sp.]|nr:signal peptidase I [Candidatus Izimaplasma bacterium]
MMKNSQIKENITIFGSAILIAILIIYILFQLFMPKLTIKVFGAKPYNVITESMEPVLDVNDIVVVKRFKIDNAEEGDIITFNADINYDGTKEIVTHYIYSITGTDENRVIRTNRHYDNMNNAVPDTWFLNEDDVIGTYWFHIPKLGYVSEFLKSPFGIAAMIVNIGVIVGVVYLIKQGNEVKE